MTTSLFIYLVKNPPTIGTTTRRLPPPPPLPPVPCQRLQKKWCPPSPLPIFILSRRKRSWLPTLTTLLRRKLMTSLKFRRSLQEKMDGCLDGDRWLSSEIDECSWSCWLTIRRFNGCLLTRCLLIGESSWIKTPPTHLLYIPLGLLPQGIIPNHRGCSLDAHT